MLQATVEDNIPFLASALSFDLLLTTIPFIVLSLAAAGYLVHHQVTTRQISLHELLARLLPTTAGRAGQGFRTVERALVAALEPRGRLTLLGLPLFLWFSTRLFGGLRAALNEVFDTDESRPWPLAKLLDLLMVLMAGSFVVANGFLSAFQASDAAVAREGFLVWWVWRLSVELSAWALGVLMFFVIFKLLPSRRIGWRTALVAAVFCSLGFEVAKRLYALYLTRFATFDRLASDANVVALFLFLIWIYSMACVFLLGGEVAEMFDLVRMRQAQRVRLQ
jgi:membrane protein